MGRRLRRKITIQIIKKRPGRIGYSTDNREEAKEG
jgi:hypothetical protein